MQAYYHNTDIYEVKHVFKTNFGWKDEMSKKNVELRMKYMKLLVKWNWWWNFTYHYAVSLNFKINFIEFQWQTVLVLFQATLYNYTRISRFKTI